jgi:hypothetical protein
MTTRHTPPAPIATSPFTVFCQQADGQGTIHIDTVEATDLDSAIQAGRERCLRDWNDHTDNTGTPFTLDDIHCLGIAGGDVTILHWEDQSG